MSGHSHWAGIKHRKGINDAKRAKVFTKLARPITIAAKEGGANPDTNFKLRLAIDKAREYNMPRENIDRAIQRGAGSGKDGIQIDELLYEAFGPGNVALIIKRQAKTETAPSAKSRAYSQRTTGSSFRPDPFHFSFRKSAKSPWKHPPNPTKPSNSMP